MSESAEWREGFRAGVEYLRPALDRANSDADYWYLRANNTPEEYAELLQRTVDAAFEQGYYSWPAAEPDPTASWADARPEEQTWLTT